MLKFLRPRSEDLREVVMVLCDAFNRLEDFSRNRDTKDANDGAKVSALDADLRLLRGDVEQLIGDVELLQKTLTELQETVEILQAGVESL